MSMYPRTNYEMTPEDLAALMDSMKPVPAMMIGGHAPRSQQENANAAWERLGIKMGFDHMTVQPNGRGDRFFSAVPSETEDQRAARLAKEKEAQQRAKVEQLQQEIAAKQKELSDILESA